MILFRCNCGAVHSLEETHAGTDIRCTQCDNDMTVPARSDSHLVLVHRPGGPEGGTTILRDELERQIVAGKAAEGQLFWNERGWRPIAEFGQAAPDAKPKLRLRQKSTPEEEDPKPQTSSAIQKVVLDEDEEEELERASQAHREEQDGLLSRRASKGQDAGLTEAASSASTPKRTRKEKKAAKGKKTPVGRIIQVILLIFALAGGYKWGVGPLVSAFREAPTEIVVQNQTDATYTCSFRWMLGIRGQSQEIPAGSHGLFTEYVGLPQTMTLKCTPTGGGDPIRHRLRFRPGRRTLVNLGGHGSFDIYDPASVAGKKVEGELKELARQVSRNQSPDAALTVSRAIRDVVGAAFVKTTTDVILSADTYRFPDSFFPDTKARDGKRTKLLCVLSGAHRISFANGYGIYNGTDDVKVDRGIRLPIKLFNLSQSRVVKSPENPLLVFSGDDSALALTLTVKDATVRVNGTEFRGAWTYSAERVLTGQNRGDWSWRWRFKGTGRQGSRNAELELQVPQQGDEQVRIKTR